MERKSQANGVAALRNADLHESLGPGHDDISTTLNDVFSETMKLPIVADLYFRRHWFQWLIKRGRSPELVCIAGDLLDMFKPETRMEQARETAVLIRELPNLVPVAVN